MGELKESKQALGAEVIAGLQDFAPPTLLAQASRLNFSTRLFNLIVTNVPGPQFPLYLLGREMQEIVPIAFLPENHALAIAIMSYNGKVDFGLLADYDAMPDIDAFAEAPRGLARRAAGGRAQGAASRTRARTAPRRTARPARRGRRRPPPDAPSISAARPRWPSRPLASCAAPPRPLRRNPFGHACAAAGRRALLPDGERRGARAELRRRAARRGRDAPAERRRPVPDDRDAARLARDKTRFERSRRRRGGYNNVFFAQRGYAVVNYSARAGSGRSCGVADSRTSPGLRPRLAPSRRPPLRGT